MGTSKNDRSPDIPSWKPALAAIGSSDVAAERQHLEIWRAAYAERGLVLERELGSPVLATACSLISQQIPLESALARFDQSARESRESSFVLDLARRAFVRCSAKKETVADFVGETFGELVTYYSSRDLPSYIGAKGRISDVSQSVDLKDQFRTITKQQVSSVGPPNTDPAGWRTYVRRVLASLRQESRRS